MAEREGLPSHRCGWEYWQMEDCGKHGDHVGFLGTEAVNSWASLRWPSGTV